MDFVKQRINEYCKNIYLQINKTFSYNILQCNFVYYISINIKGRYECMTIIPRIITMIFSDFNIFSFMNQLNSNQLNNYY